MILHELQALPLDTFQFMLAGFAVIFGVVGGYVLSLWLRFRKLNRKLHMLEVTGQKPATEQPRRES